MTPYDKVYEAAYYAARDVLSECDRETLTLLATGLNDIVAEAARDELDAQLEAGAYDHQDIVQGHGEDAWSVRRSPSLGPNMDQA